MSRLTRELAEIAAMDGAALKARWQAMEDAPAPALPDGILRRLVAQRLQERKLGGVPAAVLRELARVRQQQSGSGGDVGNGARAARPAMSVGTRLVREWNGRTISVEVRDDGFLFDEQVYGSLSQIAGIVTGSKWSGPRFFGLTRYG